jgi:hypothetical protein
LCLENDLLVLWRIRNLLAGRNDALLLRACDDAISDCYARALAGRRKYKGVSCSLSLIEFHQSLAEHCSAERRGSLHASVVARAGDHCRWQRQYTQAAEFYRLALRSVPVNPTLWCKYAVSKASGQISRGAASK